MIEAACLACAAPLSFDDEAADALKPGDVIQCLQCGHTMSVERPAPALELDLIGPVIDCPSCGTPFEVPGALAEASAVLCPSCKQSVAIKPE